jgi:hypothetical protein
VKTPVNKREWVNPEKVDENEEDQEVGSVTASSTKNSA